MPNVKPAKKIRLNDQQRELVSTNINLVHYITHRLLKSHQLRRISEADAVSVGYEALCTAAYYFDDKREIADKKGRKKYIQFSTYACRVIKQHIRYVDDGAGIIRVRPEVTRWISLIDAGHAITTMNFNITKKTMDAGRLALKVGSLNSQVKPWRLNSRDKIRSRPCSTIDLLEDEISCPAGYRLEYRETWRGIGDALDQLDKRSARIIRLRFLVDPPMHLSQIGKMLGITRERVRQIEKMALGKLRQVLGGVGL